MNQIKTSIEKTGLTIKAGMDFLTLNAQRLRCYKAGYIVKPAWDVHKAEMLEAYQTSPEIQRLIKREMGKDVSFFEDDFLEIFDRVNDDQAPRS